MSDALTGVSGVGAVGTTAPNISVALTGVSAAGVVGRTLVAFSPAEGVVMNMPGPQLQFEGNSGIVGELELEAALPTIQLTGVTGIVGELELEAALPTIQLTGVTGAVGHLAMTMPSAVIRFAEGDRLAMTMPRPSLALAGTTGSIAGLTLHMPRPQLVMVGSVPYVGVLTMVQRAPTMVFSGDTGRSGALVLQMKKLTLAMAGVTGTIGTLTMRMPVAGLELAGLRSAEGTLEMVFPAMHLQLNGRTAAAASGDQAANATTLVMQVERGALTQYTNFPFNSYCAFNGVYLAASDDGIFALTGDTDDGAAIAAAARVGTTDFGTSHLKRVERIYFGYRTDGRLILRVITDETKTRDYAVVQPTPGNVGLHGAHASLGRGVEARYWQFEVRNDAGSHFELDTMEMKPTKLRRRVGGGSA